MRRSILVAAAILGLEVAAHATTGEICGDGVDNNGNGLTDEGCYPTLTTNVCESPLSCAQTGMVSWSTGSLLYDLPPDIAPKVPHGPGIGFRRFYTSQYAPTTNPTSVNHTPLGPRWQHTYLTFLYKNAGQLVIHTSRGQDVLTTDTGKSIGCGVNCSWEIYAVSHAFGYHVTAIKEHQQSPNEFQILLQTGETLVYNSSGQLQEIWDTLPAPYTNKVIVTWTSTSNGNVSTVTDAQGKRRLLFNYTGSLLTSINYQFYTGTWTTEHTTSYSYTGGNLDRVTIGSQLAQANGYTNNYLTTISDGAATRIAAFAYNSTTAGQIDRVDTSRGTVGFEFNATRTGCSGTGETVLYFNKANTTSCTTDTDCGTGAMCGGKTGTGATGTCFKAARCLTVSNPGTPSEDVVTSVTPIGPGGGSCSGACTEVGSYTWNTGVGSNQLDLQASGDPLGNYTTATYTNGLPTKIVYGDNDTDPSTGGARKVYYSYDPTYPGKLAEIRRASDLNVNASSCSDLDATGCAQTLFTYYNDGIHNGLLKTVESKGSTYISDGGALGTYDNTTSYTYDNFGRVLEIDVKYTGSGIVVKKTVFDYWDASGQLKDRFANHIYNYSDSTNNIVRTFLDYDFRGNAIAMLDPNNNVSCRTYDSSRGYLVEQRIAMNGQADCSTSSSLDLTTDFLRDSALRLTKVTRPDLSCMIYEYDTVTGRLARTKRRDDCSAASAGDREEYTYDNDGLLTEIDTYDAANTLTQKQPVAYFASRKLQEIINPVDTSKFTGLVVDDAGRLTEIDGAGSLSRKRYVLDADNRVSSVQQYKDVTTYDTWTFLYDWAGDQSAYTDGDSKQTKSVRDDLGNLVQLVSPDLPYSPNIRSYDATNHIISEYEASTGGTGITKLHLFTYDNLGRQTAANYDGTCTANSDARVIQRTYDAPPGNQCWQAGHCNNTKGHLAYVKSTLWCDGNPTDGSFDQMTYYSYDAAGRLVEEYITDDAGRVADHLYEWTKNGALSKVTTPSTNVIGWTFDSAANNSDKDLITGMYRTDASTPVIDTVLWNPYGPLKQYNQENTSSTVPERTRITRNLAYRITGLYVETQTGANILHQVLISEDAKGRVTQRDYWPNNYGVQDSSFFYDEQDRVICEASTLTTSCPASGNKNQHNLSPPFLNAGDWKQVLRPIPGSTGVTNNFNVSGTAYGTSHQVSGVDQSSDTSFGTTNITYDSYGNRHSDGHFEGELSHDVRTYGYDARHNVVSVNGQYQTAGVWHNYAVLSYFDARNRRVSKIFSDLTSGTQSQWFFYYDPLDRLTEVRYTPDTTDATTYSLFQLFWLEDRLVAYWQVDYPLVTTSRRYVGTDESGRPIDMICWGTGGSNCPRVWGINPRAWGNDTNLIGPTVYQPILFAGQYQDIETAAWEDDLVNPVVHRPGLVLNGFRTYDPFTGGYLQVDPLVHETRSTYVYANSDPVGGNDPRGLCNDIQRMFGECATELDGGGAGGENQSGENQSSDEGGNQGPSGDGAYDPGDPGTEGIPTLGDFLGVPGAGGGWSLPDDVPPTFGQWGGIENPSGTPSSGGGAGNGTSSGGSCFTVFDFGSPSKCEDPGGAGKGWPPIRVPAVPMPKPPDPWAQGYDWMQHSFPLSPYETCVNKCRAQTAAIALEECAGWLPLKTRATRDAFLRCLEALGPFFDHCVSSNCGLHL